MLTPSIGVCTIPLTVFGSGRPAASSTVGAMSITWWNWLRISPLALMRAGQLHDERISRAAEVRGHLLGPHEGRIAGHRPARGHVREGLGPAPLVDVLQHVGHRLVDAVEVRHLVEHADHAAFGAGCRCRPRRTGSACCRARPCLRSPSRRGRSRGRCARRRPRTLPSAARRASSRRPSACPSP